MAFCTKCGTKVDGRFCPSCGYDVGGNMPIAHEEVTEVSTHAKGIGTAIKETLGQLYALRAGISFVASEKDKYDRDRASGEQKIQRLTKALEHNRTEMRICRAKIAELSPSAAGFSDERRASLQSELDEKIAKIKERDRIIDLLEQKSRNLFTIAVCLAMLILLPLAIIGMVYAGADGWILEEHISWLFLLLTIILCFVWVLGLIHEWKLLDYSFFTTLTIILSLISCIAFIVNITQTLQENTVITTLLIVCAGISLLALVLLFAIAPFAGKFYYIDNVATFFLSYIIPYTAVGANIIFLLFYTAIALPILGIFVIPVFAMFLVMVIALINAIASLNKSKTVRTKYPTDGAITRIKRELNALDEADAASKALGKERIAKSNLEERIARAEKELETIRAIERETASIQLRAMNVVFGSLIDGYSTLLDLRDWENLDLVIYYLETGRADTIKESLQQVDRQRQNDSIIDALGIAARQISETISGGMRALGATIVGCAQIVSNQLTSMSSQLDSIEASQARLGGKVARLEAAAVSEAEIVAAMKAKADTSSREMMDEIAEVRRMVSK